MERDRRLEVRLSAAEAAAIEQARAAMAERHADNPIPATASVSAFIRCAATAYPAALALGARLERELHEARRAALAAAVVVAASIASERGYQWEALSKEQQGAFLNDALDSVQAVASNMAEAAAKVPA